MLLRREGFKVNHKRLFRLYREERLMVRRRGSNEMASGKPRAVQLECVDCTKRDNIAGEITGRRHLQFITSELVIQGQGEMVL